VEQRRAPEEGLSEDELALFGLLRKENPSKTISRQAYGFRSLENYRQRVQVLCA
jgi:hypothetical protein